jgi:hypothetical protein
MALGHGNSELRARLTAIEIDTPLTEDDVTRRVADALGT